MQSGKVAGIVGALIQHLKLFSTQNTYRQDPHERKRSVSHYEATLQDQPRRGRAQCDQVWIDVLSPTTKYLDNEKPCALDNQCPHAYTQRAKGYIIQSHQISYILLASDRPRKWNT